MSSPPSASLSVWRMRESEPNHSRSEQSDHKTGEQLGGGLLFFGLYGHEAEEVGQQGFLRQDIWEEPNAAARQNPDGSEHQGTH